MLINEISSAELAEMMSGDTPPRLIDVRSAGEVTQSSLLHAEHMSMHTIPLKISELDKSHKMVFYCRTGTHLAQVYYFLKQQGFDNAINLRGGIVDWVQDGREIVSGTDVLPEAV